MTHRIGKTTSERLMYGAPTKRRGDVFTVDHGEMTRADLGETVVRDFGATDLRARLTACRDDRRFKRTPENSALKVALILEAREAGWTNSDIARQLWTSSSAITKIITKAVAA